MHSATLLLQLLGCALVSAPATRPVTVLTADGDPAPLTLSPVRLQSGSHGTQAMATTLRPSREAPISQNSTQSWREQLPRRDRLLRSEASGTELAQAPAHSVVFA